MKIYTRDICTQDKILSIINSLGNGGAENQLMQFILYASGKTRMKFDVAVLYDGCFRIDMLKHQGINVMNLNVPNKYSIRVIWKVVRLIKKGNYGIVFAHLSPTIFYVAIASIFLPNVTFILRETNVYSRRRKYCIFKIIDRFMYLRYKKIICVDKKVESELIKWIPSIKGKTITFRKGITLPVLRRDLKKKYDIIFVGRLTRQKGVETLLNALAILKSQHIIKKCIIVGNGPLMDSLKNETDKLGISYIVKFLGTRYDVYTLLQQSRLFVLPSRWEGTPSALLEAMAVRLPVIAANVGGVPEVINDGVDGVLISPNDPSILAEVIKRICSDDKYMKTLGNNARKKIEDQYSIQSYSNNMLRFFQSI